MNLVVARHPSPIGIVFTASRGGALCALGFEHQWPSLDARLRKRFVKDALLDGIDAPVANALEAYFQGDLEALDALLVDAGGTPFQASVWRALRTIKAGQTSSYAKLARAIEAPRAVRAVGAANGRNPISLVLPCHRVIGASGDLTGYAGGLARKAWLLEHEARFSRDDAKAERGSVEARP